MNATNKTENPQSQTPAQKGALIGVIDLNHVVEFSNVCAKCGAVDTLFPMWKGRRCFHVCSKDAGGCGEIARGITAYAWNAKHPDDKRAVKITLKSGETYRGVPVFKLANGYVLKNERARGAFYDREIKEIVAIPKTEAL